MNSQLTLIVTIEHEGNIPSAARLADIAEEGLSHRLIGLGYEVSSKSFNVDAKVLSSFITRQERSSFRWVKVCQDCLEGLRPDMYFPDAMSWDTCAYCKQDVLVANVSPKELG